MPPDRCAEVALELIFQLDPTKGRHAPGQGSIERGAPGFARQLQELLAHDRHHIPLRDQIEKLIPEPGFLPVFNSACVRHLYSVGKTKRHRREIS